MPESGSILHNGATVTDQQSELLHFSLVTLSTMGYGDIVPLRGEVRMLAALEGVTAVLYIAITVALLVRVYKRQSSPLTMSFILSRERSVAAEYVRAMQSSISSHSETSSRVCTHRRLPIVR